MLNIKSLFTITVLASAVLLTACNKKDTENKEPESQIVNSASEAEATTPAKVTPPDQIDAAP